MSYFLIMVILNSSGSSIATQNIKFKSQPACLEAMQKLIDLEKHFVIKATCVRDA